jgi:hypothetical protein
MFESIDVLHDQVANKCRAMLSFEVKESFQWIF